MLHISAGEKMAFVSIRLEDELLRKVGSCMKDLNYSTKTEFIRSAIRDKIKEAEKEKRRLEQWDKLLAMRGTLVGKAKTDEEFRKLKEEAGEEYLKELDKNFGIKKY